MVRIVESENSSLMVFETGSLVHISHSSGVGPAYLVRRSRLKRISSNHRTPDETLTIDRGGGFVHEQELVPLENRPRHAKNGQRPEARTAESGIAHQMSCFSPLEKLSPPSLTGLDRSWNTFLLRDSSPSADGSEAV